MDSFKLISLIAILFFALSVSAVEVQDKTNALVIGQAFTLKSEILKEERPIWIYLPESYHRNENKQYPVLYMLDGAFHFHHITGAVQVLAKRNRIPEMIVVAIPYVDDQKRNRDLTPLPFNGRPPIAEADKFLAFIKEEVIPFAEGNSRTKAYRMLFGHSLAGLFAINTLVEEPTLFNAYFAISPSLYWADRFMFEKIKSFSLDSINASRQLFLSVADGDRDQIRTAVIDFADLMNRNKLDGLTFNYSFIQNQDHGSIVHPVFYENMTDLFAEWHLEPEQIESFSLEQVKDYYKSLSIDFGYEMPVPINYSLSIARRNIQEGDNQQATEVLNFVLAQNSGEAEAHFLLGFIDANNGDREQAKVKIEKALSFMKSDHPSFQAYQNYLNNVMERKED